MPKEDVAERARKKSKKTTGGNTKPDVEWLDKMSAEGLLFEVDPETRPAEMLYDIHYQWDGDAGDLDLEFFERYRRSERKCNGTAYIRDESGMYIVDNDWQRLTRPCLSHPARGGTVCHAHGAKIPQVVAAAQRRLAEASEIVAMRLVGLTGTRDEEGYKIRPQDRITAMGSVLDRAGVKGGVEVEVTASGFQQVLQDLFGTESDSGDES